MSRILIVDDAAALTHLFAQAIVSSLDHYVATVAELNEVDPRPMRASTLFPTAMTAGW